MSNNNNTVQDTTHDIVCPYCFKRFTNNRVLFVDYRKTVDEIYPEYAEYMRHYLNLEPFGDRKMPYYFQKTGNDGIRDYFSALTEQGDVTHTRACPYCYNVLPASVGRMKAFPVVVLGADDGQRSYYIASLLHKLNRGMSADFGASFIPADFRTADTFYTQYEEPLYKSRIVPEAITSVTPLIFEFTRNGALSSEEWKGSEVTYNRALIYIYNIDRDLCERYPMAAFEAVSRAGGIVFVSDAAETERFEDPTYEPWLGFLTETFRRVFGANPIEIPSAIVLSNADKSGMTADRKWNALVRSALIDHVEKAFPTKYFEGISEKAVRIMSEVMPAYMSALNTLFDREYTMYFPSKSFFSRTADGGADMNHSSAEISFLWLMSRFSMISGNGNAGNIKK